MALSICSINVNGIAERSKRERAFNFLQNYSFDICLLKETHLSTLLQGESWNREWGGSTVWSPGSNRSRGVGILCSPANIVKIIDHNIDTHGRIATVLLQHQETKLQLMCVHAPNNASAREVFFNSLSRFSFQNVETVITGDFNCVSDILLDKWGGDDIFGNKGIAQLHSFTSSLRLEDCFRVCNPRLKSYTWFNGPHSVGCRLNRQVEQNPHQKRQRRHLRHLLRATTNSRPRNSPHHRTSCRHHQNDNNPNL